MAKNVFEIKPEGRRRSGEVEVQIAGGCKE
jgi:hypothetical protein